MPNQQKYDPISFRPPEADRVWLLAYHEATGVPVNRILAEALALYRKTTEQEQGMTMDERVSVEPESGDIEFASMGKGPDGDVLITLAARDEAALRNLHLALYANPATGEWMLTLKDSMSRAPQVRQADRFGREWRLSWPHEAD